MLLIGGLILDSSANKNFVFLLDYAEMWELWFIHNQYEKSGLYSYTVNI